jgi:Fic family protein
MIIPPKYRLTKKIVSHIANIEANRQVIGAIKIPLEVEENFRRKSVFGSSLFSARIEGNSLTEAEVSSFQDLSENDQEKLEVTNLYRAISHVLVKVKEGYTFNKKDFLGWHEIVMKGILAPSYCGRFRTKHEGVFDSMGNLIYHSPAPSEVSGLIEKMLSFINGKTEKIIPVKAILSHLILEKIHPFVDGSGRMGRLLQLAVMSKYGFGMNGMSIVEKKIYENRPIYYHTIEHSTNSDSTGFVDFMLEIMDEASSEAKEELLAKRDYSDSDLLLPRRKEIFEIIRDQRIVSLDFLSRRFLKVDPRSLRNDLLFLVKKGFVEKIGKTRGALYTTRK